ncbi:MAG: cadherin-like beta sandwich domain-containing protein [Lachnospiraceae bacterium]|nr:cadherin-like beta sandwich domain-containing protein [Lachnospiraceae bacterium]
MGDRVDVEMTVNSELAPGSLQAYILYSPDVLEYVGDVSIIAGGEGILKISDNNMDSSRNESKYVLRFKAVGRGYADISLRDNIELYELEEGYLMSVSSNSLMIGVDAAQTASKDASLSSLKISPGKLNPRFTADEFEYNTTVPYDTEQLFVSAVASSPEATVSVSGVSLSVGQNRVLVTVTAENGSSQKYVIYCVREKESSKEPEAENNSSEAENSDAGNQSGNESKNDADTETKPAEDVADNSPVQSTNEADTQTAANEHWKFYALKNDDKVFIFADTEYEAAEKPEELEIPAGYIKTSIIVSGNRLTAYAPSDKTEGDFLLLVLKRYDTEPALYRYDRKEKTIQRYTGKTETIVSPMDAAENLENKELKESYEKSLGTMTLIIAVLSGISMILLIVVIRFAVKSGKDDEE